MIDHCLKRQTQDSDRKRTCPLFFRATSLILGLETLVDPAHFNEGCYKLCR